MIECISAENMMYFISLMGDVAKIIENVIYIFAEESTTIWAFEGISWCRVE